MTKSKLTPKENFMRLIKGEVPEYIPIYDAFDTMGDKEGFNGETTIKDCGPKLFEEHRNDSENAHDIWGVPYVSSKETNYAGMPDVNKLILKDITKWDKVIKAPKLPDHIDWEAMAAKDIADCKIDRNKSIMQWAGDYMPFQFIMALMGFADGLCALHEEPEAVKDLLDFVTSFYEPIIENYVKFYKPDLLVFADDTATKLNPFISLDMFRELFLPHYKRLFKPAVDRGLPVLFHNCGNCQIFMEDMVEIGTRFWHPAQDMNDLLGIKEKYKGKLNLVGVYEYFPPASWPVVDEKQVRQTVRDCIDKYAQGGGFVFCGSVLGKAGDTMADTVNGWIVDEAYYYGRDYYLNNPAKA